MYSYNNYSKEAHMKQYNWATPGCGVIANELANALSKQGRTLYSVANRTHEKAVSFAQYHLTKLILKFLNIQEACRLPLSILTTDTKRL